jgi:hypothetical protein
MDPYRQFLNEEKISWSKFFWVMVVFLGILLALLGLAFLIVNVTSYESNPYFKLLHFLLYCFLGGGFWVFLVKYTETWDESLMDIQNTAYFTSKLNNRLTYQLVGFEFSEMVGDYSDFFVFLHHGMKTKNYSKETDMNMGKKGLSIFFDFVATDGQLRIYVTTSLSKSGVFKSAMSQFFPKVLLIECQDPYKGIKQEYKSGELDLEDISGFSLGLTQSNLFVPSPIGDVDKTNDLSIKNLLTYIKSASKGRLIALQYGFIFADSGIQKKYNPQFDVYLKSLTDQYSPAVSKDEEKTVSSYFPKEEVTKYNAIYKRLNNIWFMTAMRVMCYDKNQHSQKMLERMFKTFFEQSNLPLDIMYLTSTEQTYFKYTKKNRQPEPDEIYDNMYYPEAGFETVIAPFYDKLYYPKESKLRKGTILRSFLARNPIAPWHPKFMCLDPDVIKHYFYIGK